MPIVSIDAPAGLALAGKQRLMREINAALGAAFGITDNIIFLREYSRENVAIAGVLRSDDSGAERAHPRKNHSPSIST